jgi:hypothetical protein
MLVTPFRDWLAEQERRRGLLFFLLEWLMIFAAALAFWTVLLLQIHRSTWSVAAAAAISSLYASFSIYIRFLRLSVCRKCHSPLALTQRVIGHRYVQERERCLEIERGGQEWYGHFIDLYTRHYRVEVVKYRCRRCNRVWEQSTEEPAGNYELVRTIEVKD